MRSPFWGRGGEASISPDGVATQIRAPTRARAPWCRGQADQYGQLIALFCHAEARPPPLSRRRSDGGRSREQGASPKASGSVDAVAPCLLTLSRQEVPR